MWEMKGEGRTTGMGVACGNPLGLNGEMLVWEVKNGLCFDAAVSAGFCQNERDARSGSCHSLTVAPTAMGQSAADVDAGEASVAPSSAVETFFAIFRFLV